MGVRRRLVITVVLMLTAQSLQLHAESLDKDYWYEVSQNELKSSLSLKPNTNVAKNLVLAIGDGMGVTTTTAMRLLKGQRTDGMLGEEAELSWDKFPHVCMSKTYSTDMMTVDSAASGTAYHCGVKTKYNTLGVDNNIVLGDCDSVAAARVSSILDWALLEGKSVGLISTDSLTGASPASAYAHSAHRDWTNDKELPKSAMGKCKDIARQLIEENLDIQVLLGGGRADFYSKTANDSEYPDVNGNRKDNRNLVDEWLAAHLQKQRKARYVTNKSEFDLVTPANTDYLLGLFEPERMQEETDRRVNKTEPSLAEMTELAIRILSQNPRGFYLFIEGANIDKGHHETRARKALEEGLSLDNAVAKVMEMTSSDDTLVVVSADHSHTLSLGGYAERGQDILSIANNSIKDDYKDIMGNFYTILSYANGPGYAENRTNHSAEYYSVDRLYPATVPLKSETHGGEDVQIFASGPMSHLFNGVKEQTYIAHVMAYAACIGENKGHCSSRKSPTSAAEMININRFLLSSMCIFLWSYTAY